MAIKKKLKAVARFMESVLPHSIFTPIWKLLYASYKAGGRGLYRLKSYFIYTPFNQDKWKMAEAIQVILPRTYVGIKGLETTYQLCQDIKAKNIPGDFVELGVARGGCAALMGTTIFNNGTSPSRSLWLFDSFEGLPDPTEKDFDQAHGEGTGDHVHVLKKGDCLGTLEDVQQFLMEARKFPKDRVHFIKGWFENTVPAERHNIQKIAVLRIDGDWYESTKTCLEGLYDLVSPGGAVIIDDYESCYGCKKATDEFLSIRNIHANIILDNRGGCYFIKP